MSMITLAIDAMGGDFAPEMTIKGVIKALLEDVNLCVYLYGDQKKINSILSSNLSIATINHFKKKQMKIIHTDSFLNMNIIHLRDELTNNPQHSMFLALEAAHKGLVDGVISAGPTQALVFASYFIIKTVPFVKRTALSIVFSSLDHRNRILLDAGANLYVQPEQLLHFAICASVMAKELLCISNPKVKLLNIGVESNKGREFEKEAFNLLKKDLRINFCGNEEPQNLFRTDADILINDGFVSNMILKSYEGAFELSMQVLKQVLSRNWLLKIISKICYYRQIKNIQKTLDYKEVGGAMLLGLNKIVVKAHGNSQEYAFYKAIIQAKRLVEQKILDKIFSNFQNKINH
ncbi:MAG: phosphate acyltransferase PlsX [Vigna little leaf phytoplasma]|nr:phosphate acyltransferase PlsX [Vigna little leaf phytoplasma]